MMKGEARVVRDEGRSKHAPKGEGRHQRKQRWRTKQEAAATKEGVRGSSDEATQRQQRRRKMHLSGSSAEERSKRQLR